MARTRLLMTSLAPKLALLMGALILAGSLPCFADSTVIDGPGFKLEQKHGWFGRKSTVYHDALGNKIERSHGLFGGETTRTKVFGSEAVQTHSGITGRNGIEVNGPNGQPLISRKRTLFGGQQTRVDGTSILESVKNIFKP